MNFTILLTLSPYLSHGFDCSSLATYPSSSYSRLPLRLPIDITSYMTGQKQSHPESHIPEPRTPSAKRRAIREQNTPHLTPEAKRRRLQMIKDAQASISLTSPNQLPVPMPGINDALLHARDATPTPTPHAGLSVSVPQPDRDEEEEFWLSTPPGLRRRSPSGEFSAAGYRLGTPSNGARSPVRERSSANGRGAMPTPPRSSPAVEFNSWSPTSTFQVSEILRSSQSPGPSQSQARNGAEDAVSSM